MVDIIRASIKGLKNAAGENCAVADKVHRAVIGGQFRDELKKLPEDKIAAVTEGAIGAAREGAKVEHAIEQAIGSVKKPAADITIESDALRKLFANPAEASKKVETASKKIDASAKKLVKPEPLVSSVIHQQKGAQKPVSSKPLGHLNQAQKAAFGLSALFAAFSAIGTLDALSKVNKKDPDGINHIQPTQVGLALLNGVLTVGLGYAAFQQYHGR